jgi:hypothetical protein
VQAKRRAYLGSDDHGFRYWMVAGLGVYREWPKSGGVSDFFCEWARWIAGKNSVLNKRKDSRYVYTNE